MITTTNNNKFWHKTFAHWQSYIYMWYYHIIRSANPHLSKIGTVKSWIYDILQIYSLIYDKRQSVHKARPMTTLRPTICPKTTMIKKIFYHFNTPNNKNITLTSKFQIFTLKIFAPEKYTPLKNIYPWKIFLPKNILTHKFSYPKQFPPKKCKKFGLCLTRREPI